MYKVIIEDKIVDTIDNFIDYYLNSFLDLFVDTGIDNVELIISSYEKSSELFRDKIYFYIILKLKEDIIGKKVLEDGYSTTVIVGNYRIFVFFEEDQKNKTRFINNLEFNKK